MLEVNLCPIDEFGNFINEVIYSLPDSEVNYKKYLAGIDDSGGYEVDNMPKILIRTRLEAGHAGKPSQHGCSVKVAVKGMSMQRNGVPVYVPPRPFDAPKSANHREGMKKFMATSRYDGFKFSIGLRNAVRNFIYENQVEILMYWNLEHQDRKVREWLEKWFLCKVKGEEYFSKDVTGPLSAEQLAEELRAVRRSLFEEYGFDDAKHITISGIDEIAEMTGFAFDEYYRED